MIVVLAVDVQKRVKLAPGRSSRSFLLPPRPRAERACDQHREHASTNKQALPHRVTSVAPGHAENILADESQHHVGRDWRGLVQAALAPLAFDAVFPRVTEPAERLQAGFRRLGSGRTVAR